MNFAEHSRRSSEESSKRSSKHIGPGTTNNITINANNATLTFTAVSGANANFNTNDNLTHHPANIASMHSSTKILDGKLQPKN